MGVVFGRLARLAVVDFGVQWGLFVLAAALRTEKFYDFSGSCTFLLLVGTAIQRARARQSGTLSARQVAAAFATCTWATRLGTFLLARVIADDGDRRFDKVSTPIATLARTLCHCCRRC